MIAETHLRVLQTIHARLADREFTWALTGSTCFALQGVPVQPHDIDVQTDANGAYAIARLFPEYVTREVAFSSAERIRSHFGALEIYGLTVEIMGDIEKSLSDGCWEPAPDLRQHRQFVEIAGMRIPVLSLEYEYQAYLTLERVERAKLLRTFIDQHLS